MSEDLLEYVATIPVIKAFSNEETRTGKVLQGMRDYIQLGKKTACKHSGSQGDISMFLEGGVVVMIITGLGVDRQRRPVRCQLHFALILGGIFASCFVKLSTFQHFGIV